MSLIVRTIMISPFAFNFSLSTLQRSTLIRDRSHPTDKGYTRTQRNFSVDCVTVKAWITFLPADRLGEGQARWTILTESTLRRQSFERPTTRGNVNQLLSVFREEGFTDMSEDGPNRYGKAAREALGERLTELFAEYSVKLTVIVNAIVVLGRHCVRLRLARVHAEIPENGGETIRRRHRYFELWNKNSSGDWKISLFINNADIREESGWPSQPLVLQLKNAQEQPAVPQRP